MRNLFENKPESIGKSFKSFLLNDLAFKSQDSLAEENLLDYSLIESKYGSYLNISYSVGVNSYFTELYKFAGLEFDFSQDINQYQKIDYSDIANQYAGILPEISLTQDGEYIFIFQDSYSIGNETFRILNAQSGNVIFEYNNPESYPYTFALSSEYLDGGIVTLNYSDKSYNGSTTVVLSKEDTESDFVTKLKTPEELNCCG